MVAVILTQDLKFLRGDVVFSEDGKKLIGSGAVKIRFEWDDDPDNKGLAVRQVKDYWRNWTR